MRSVSFTLNGKPTRLTVDETRPLLWVLRDDLGLTVTEEVEYRGHRCVFLRANTEFHAQIARLSGTSENEIRQRRLRAQGSEKPFGWADQAHGDVVCAHSRLGLDVQFRPDLRLIGERDCAAFDEISPLVQNDLAPLGQRYTSHQRRFVESSDNSQVGRRFGFCDVVLDQKRSRGP